MSNALKVLDRDLEAVKLAGMNDANIAALFSLSDQLWYHHLRQLLIYHSVEARILITKSSLISYHEQLQTIPLPQTRVAQ